MTQARTIFRNHAIGKTSDRRAQATMLCSVLLVLFAARDGGAAVAPAGDFATFFAKFRSALERNDAKAVADLTKLPFLFDGKPRDHGSFQSVYPELFDGKVRACFQSGKASRERDRYVVHCGRYIFYFAVAGARYQLVEFAADPEAAP